MLGKTIYEEEIHPIPFEILDGEAICPQCEGIGTLWGYPCDRCLGAKKLDWIERITGRECPFEESGRSASSSGSSSSSSRTSTS